MTMHESQVLVKARYHGKAQSFDVALLSHTVKEVLDHCGEIMAFRVERVEEGLASFRVEYFDTQSVEHALSYVEGRKLGVSYAFCFCDRWPQANLHRLALSLFAATSPVLAHLQEHPGKSLVQSSSDKKMSLWSSLSTACIYTTSTEQIHMISVPQGKPLHVTSRFLAGKIHHHRS